MKNLVLIVHESVHIAVIDRLRALEVEGFTVAQVEGHGAATTRDAFLSGRDRVVGFVPRVRIDLVIGEEEAERVLAALSNPGSGLTGHGAWWLFPVERAGGF